MTTIQTKLKRWGYFDGPVDGIYGSKTSKAVRSFQRKNGLIADGVAGPATLKALGMEQTSQNSGSSQTGSSGGNASGDVALLAKVISAEARGEPYDGQVAVGAVILNRIAHPSFPNTLAGVVYEPGAFTCMVDGQIDQPIASSAYQAARDALNGTDPSGGAIYYFNPVTATSAWIVVKAAADRHRETSVLFVSNLSTAEKRANPRRGFALHCAITQPTAPSLRYTR